MQCVSLCHCVCVCVYVCVCVCLYFKMVTYAGVFTACKIPFQDLRSHMKLKCRCHGVSGSCAVKTCWRTMPSFKEVGRSLKQKYERSVQIAPKSRNKLRRKDKRMRRARTAATCSAAAAATTPR